MRAAWKPLFLVAQQGRSSALCVPTLWCFFRFNGGKSGGDNSPDSSSGLSSTVLSPIEKPGVLTTRDVAIERLSCEVFGKGNQHLKNVETLTSLPEGLHSFPEVCFIGKPNSGKSSLISCLLHNRKLAKTGNVRGTTRLLQFFNVGDALLLVDTPGYGGWKGRKLEHRPKDRANAFAILFRYLALRKGGNLKQVYWCMEASATTPMALRPRDEEILSFLQREQIPFTVVLTKIDRHWHHYHEQMRKLDTVGRDGVPNVAPWRQKSQHHREGIYDGSYPARPVDEVPTPTDGVRQNMAEICDFLGSVDVPILGVSANRWRPERSMNLEAVQHDIVDHCTRELVKTEDLTYRNIHELSYAPPRAVDIERVQLTYPIESFVVPQDDRVSLQEMVDRHEDAKAQLVSQSTHFDLLSAKDLREGFLEDSRVVHMAQAAEDEQRQLQSELPPNLAFASQSVRHQLLGATVASTKETALGGTSEAIPAVLPRRFSSRASLRERTEAYDGTRDWWSGDQGETMAAASRETPAAQLVTLPHAVAAGADVPDAAPSAVPFAITPSRPKVSAPIPFSLDREAHTVTAINGVRIPRTLVPTSVEDLAIGKEDEVSAFAAKSGAGAYEELLIYDHLHGNTPESQTFMEASATARLSEAELDALRRVRTKSAAQRQKEQVLSKYVDRDRKERSIYVQAEGYMNPWVGRTCGSGGDRRPGTVVGLAGTAHAPTGRTGALLKGLKQSGFGGKSYSARTKRGTGRATKKTGSWAA